MAKKNLANALGAFTAPAANSTPATPATAPQHQTADAPNSNIETKDVPAKVKKINQTIQFEPEFAREVKQYILDHSTPEDKLTIRELVMRSLREHMAAHP